MPRKSWWARLPFGVRMVAGTSALLIAIGGGVAGVAALTRDRDSAKSYFAAAAGDPEVPGPVTSEEPTTVPPLTGEVAARARTLDEADRTAGRKPARQPVPLDDQPSPATAEPSQSQEVAAAPQPTTGRVVTTRTEVVTREIPYSSRTVSDPKLRSGRKRVQTPGVAGEETVRYLVTLTDGKPTGRRLLDATVTRQPQQEVVAVGSRSGSGACPLDVCLPFGRDATCRHHRRDEGGEATQGGQLDESGQVSVDGNDLALLGGGHGDGDDELGDGHHGFGGHWGGGRGC